MYQIINNLGAIITICFGLMGLVTPHLASKFTGLTATNKTSFAEFRGTFGGMFVVMGAIPLLTHQPLAYFTTGLFWMGAAFGRIVSIILDKGWNEPKNIGGIFVEALIGGTMLLGNTDFMSMIK
jgi:hypothetical protein